MTWIDISEKLMRIEPDQESVTEWMNYALLFPSLYASGYLKGLRERIVKKKRSIKIPNRFIDKNFINGFMDGFDLKPFDIVKTLNFN